LHADFLRRHAEAVRRHPGAGLYFADDEVEAFSRSRLTAWRETAGQTAMARRARMMERFAEEALVRVAADDLLVGSQKFCSRGFPGEIAAELKQLGCHHNIGHIIHDYAGLLEHGVGGFLERIRRRQTATLTAGQGETLDAFARAMRAFSRFILRHAEAAETMASSLQGDQAGEWQSKAVELRVIALDPPVSFSGALQLVWFAQIFLHAENPSSAISFGRADQYLWPFLERDFRSSSLSQDEAQALVGAFFLRCCEGDESQNLTVGGVDAGGGDATNPLSVMMLEVMRHLRVFQPSLTVRLHSDSPSELTAAACALAAAGIGQPGFINDRAVIPGLMELGIPLERARDYGIVGCYEAAPQGDSYPLTVANCYMGGSPTLPRILVDFMRSPIARSAGDFAAFMEGWLAAVQQDYQTALSTGGQAVWNHWRDQAPSPFGSVLMKDCIGRGTPLEAGGAVYNLFGINILGLGTVIDSLLAVDEMVFRQRAMAVEALAEAVDGDFPDESLRRKLMSLPGRYGTDAGETNRLAAEVSTRVARIVLDSRLEQGVRPYPGFFRFTADVWDHPYATPDGRHARDTLSYGCGPSSASGATPTAALASVAHVAHALCACGNPLALALPAEDAQGQAGIGRLRALILGYFNMGGFHVHFNLHSTRELHEAKADPVRHADLTIRISGLSARFVTLPEPIQDALIERAGKGV
jgi:formate C-acetyltransferase